MNSAETVGPELETLELLRVRMVEDSARVLGAVPGGDVLVRRVLDVADGSIDDLREAIADGFEQSLDWMHTEDSECRKLRSRAASRRVPTHDRHDVVGDAFLDARDLVGQFRRAEGKFGGAHPDHATPAYSSFWGWMRGRVDASCTTYWRERRRLVSVADLADRHDPTATTPEEQAVDAARPGNHRAIGVRRLLLRRARHVLSENLASPDLRARRNGPDRSLQLTRVLVATSRLFVRAEGEPWPGEPAAAPRNVVRLADECAREVLLEDPRMHRDDTDKPLQRGLRSDVLFATAGALRVALSVDVPKTLGRDIGLVVDAVSFHLLELQIALQLAQIKPVVMLLGYRITSLDIGARRFAADLLWIEELLGWVAQETSPAQQTAAAVPALRWLDEIDSRSTRRESPIERARREIDEVGPKVREASELLGIHERLRAIAEGSDR